MDRTERFYKIDQPHRIARYLECQRLLERDAEHSYRTTDTTDEDPMDQLSGRSITYRTAVGCGMN